MITGSIEYQEYLANQANSYNPPNILIRIPADEPVYEVNLDTRVISPPPFLGVEADHEAEYIYFECDRYYDSIDLSQCICAVQFKNAKHEEYMYIIPAYDTLSVPNKLIFAWNIQSPVTKYGGVVQFSFKFFKIDKASGELLYELNTLVCKTKVLVGWASKDGANHNYNQFTVDEVLTSFSQADNQDFWTKIQTIYDAAISGTYNLYWIDV